MAAQLVELITFSPANPLWSSVADCSRYLASALSAHDGYLSAPAFDLRPSEIIGSEGPPMAEIRARLKALLRSHGRSRNVVLHADMDALSVREFWGLLEAQRFWPDAPCTVLMHDPPALPSFPPGPDLRRAGGVFGGLVTGLSELLARHGQEKVMERFMSRVSGFLSLTPRGAARIAERYPAWQDRVGVLPAWSMGSAPPSLEPNARELPDRICMNAYVDEGTIGGLVELLDALAVTNRQLSLSGRVSVSVRGTVHGVADQRAIEKQLRARIKSLKIEWLVDMKLGLMNDRMLDDFLTQTDILILPLQESAGYRTCVPYMRAQAWAVAVVAADTGFLRELVQDDVDGCFYTPGQPVALARRLLELLTEPDRRIALASALRRKAITERSPQSACEALHRIHTELLSARDEKRDPVFPDAARVFQTAGGETATP